MDAKSRYTVVEWPDFFQEVRGLYLDSAQRAALEAISDYEDGPRSVDEWVKLVNEEASERARSIGGLLTRRLRLRLCVEAVEDEP